VRLGAEIVLTGEDGTFLLGTARAAPVPLAVLTDELIAGGAFDVDVVSAPGRGSAESSRRCTRHQDCHAPKGSTVRNAADPQPRKT
jgi:hypothetical protein